MFDRYALQSIALPHSNDYVMAMEFVAEENVIIIGYNSGRITIWYAVAMRHCVR
jgi:hypothetical protein